MTSVQTVKDFSNRPSCKNSLQKSWSWLAARMQYYLFGKVKVLSPGFTSNRLRERKSAVSTLRVRFADSIHTIEKNSVVQVDNFDDFLLQQEPIRRKFLDLPFQVRARIYDFIDVDDVLSLRLTSSFIKHDVELCRGFVIRLHDGRIDFEKPLQQIGVEKLIVEQFVEEEVNYGSLLPLPHLLRSLEIRGNISGANLQFLLETCFNLETLTVLFQYPNQRLGSTGRLWEIDLDNLKSLEIASTMFAASESRGVSNTTGNFLQCIECPNLCTFYFHFVGFMPATIKGYHMHALNFLKRTSTFLKRVRIQLTTVLNHASTTLESIQVMDDWENGKSSRFQEIQLKMNNNVRLWYPVLDAQTHLRRLNLEMAGQSWNRLILVLDKSVRTLQSLCVIGLCSSARNGIIIPVDLGLLRNLRRLEIVEIRHLDMESRGQNSPSVLRTSELPKSLKVIQFSHLQLRPHQSLFLFVKLPNLRYLDLEYWTDSEATLAGFLTVLTFLIKFDQTGVRRMRLTDARRKLENMSNEMTRMTNMLRDRIAFFYTNSETFSTLDITRLHE